MLRREPSRIEMKPEDIEEFDAYVAQQKRAAKDDAGAPESKKDRSKAERDARIGVRRPADPMTDSPGS